MAKDNIHPQYHQSVDVQCMCGALHNLSSPVSGPIKVETCSKCHPVYTGKKETKVVKWRMEKFNEKMKKIQALQTNTKK
jgi:large subunit ribosomal protein L31